MTAWALENIKGFLFDGKCVCSACIQDERVDDMKTMQLVTRDELQKMEKRLYCDRCGAGL